MRATFCLVIALVFSSALKSEDLKREHTITLDDYFSQRDLFTAVISPTGKHVAYIAGQWDKEDDRRHTHLWVVEVESKKVQRLTVEGGSDHSPQWDSEGKWVFFMGRRKRGEAKKAPWDGTSQVWRVRVDGEKLQPITRIKGGVDSFVIPCQSESILYTTSREHVDDDFKKLRTTHKLNYGHGIKQVSVLWHLNTRTWRKTKILDNGRVIREMSIDPTGSKLAMITTPDNKVISFEGKSRVDVLDLTTHRVSTLPEELFRKKAASPYGWLEHLAWSPDGRRLAFNVIFDAYPNEVIVAEWLGNQTIVSKMDRPKGLTLRGYGTPLAWLNKTDLCFLADTKARSHLYCCRAMRRGRQGKIEALVQGPIVVDGFSIDPNSERIAFIMNDDHSLPDVYVYKKGSFFAHVTDLNPQVMKWKLPKISTVTWKSKGGVEVEGVLELPPDYRPGKRIPLVVAIHGGPTTCDRCQLRFWIYGRTLLPSQGYAVLCPNYRGSTGYGDQFLIDLVGKENNVDVADILSGVDYLVKKGIADPDRLGVMGWSNGGYLTNCILTKSARFKAASSGASILDTVMEWGSNDEPAYPMVFKTGAPWERPDIYKKTSPTYDLNKVCTPTLIHVGARDERCPPSHSRMLYRALKEYVKVPTELLVYPGEPHGLRKYSSRRAKLAWDLAWFKKYLK